MSCYGDLLPSEHMAAKLVESIGIARASFLIEAVGNHMQKRADKYNAARTHFDYAYDSIGVAHNRELKVLHILKIGVTVCDTHSTPYAARERLQARVAERRARRRFSNCSR